MYTPWNSSTMNVSDRAFPKIPMHIFLLNLFWLNKEIFIPRTLFIGYCTVTGFGLTKFHSYSHTYALLRADVEVMRDEDCQNAFHQYKRRLPVNIAPTMLCAGGGAQDACQVSTTRIHNGLRDGRHISGILHAFVSY